MFTGITEQTAVVINRATTSLTVSRPSSFTDIKEGGSISVSGVCLSVSYFDRDSMTFDVMPETLSKSRLGELNKGDHVNLERALLATDRFEGHVVQGHVEGVGIVITAPTPNPSPGTGEGRRGGGISRGTEKKRYPSRTIVNRARDMRKNPTKSEQVLWESLRKRKIGECYFRRQRPVGNYVLDFYCEEHKLGIEIDGGIHNDADRKEYDEDRSQELLARGINIMRFSNEDVLKNLDSVLGDIDRNISRDVRITVKIPKELVRFIVPKGSIALDGISLTVAHIENDLCTVALIPQTLDRTTLGKLNKGDHINVETDVMVRSLCNQPVS